MIDLFRSSKNQNYYNVGPRARGPFYGFAIYKAGYVELYYYNYLGYDLTKSINIDDVPYEKIGNFKSISELKEFAGKLPNTSIPSHIL